MIAANGIVVAVATPRTDKATQRRHRPRPSSSGRPFVVTLVFVGLLVAAFYGYRSYRDRHVTITFDNGQDPVPALDLTFFPDQLAFRAPSPPPALGMQRLENGASVVVGEDLVPGHGIVRYQGEGVGSGVAYVQLGKPPPTIQLRLPQTLSGRVGEPEIYWFMGWPSAGFRPVVDAEVVVMGGGEHGIDLATTRTDAEGRFSVTG